MKFQDRNEAILLFKFLQTKKKPFGSRHRAAETAGSLDRAPRTSETRRVHPRSGPARGVPSHVGSGP